MRIIAILLYQRGVSMNRIELSKEQKKMAIDEIRIYFEKEREDQIGELAGELILDFIIEKVGPYIYNQAIMDVQKYMNEKTEDLYAFMI